MFALIFINTVTFLKYIVNTKKIIYNLFSKKCSLKYSKININFNKFTKRS